MRRRFFVEQFDGDSAVLRGDTAEHLGRVLRAQPGQLYELSDGERVWLGRIEQVALSKRGDNRIEFALVQPIEAHEAALAIQILLSIVKFDRFEWCLEKATELGVMEIIPLGAARTDKPLLAAAGKRHARWEKIIAESAQQSRRVRPPALADTVTSDIAFANCAAPCKIILSERREAPPLRETLASCGRITAAALAFGPEGGWSDEELAAAHARSFAAASLGENILRTETAVIAALSVLRFAASA